MSEERRLIRKPEAAKMLGDMSMSTLDKLTCRGKIPHVKIESAVYYDTADLWDWIESKKIGKPPRATAVAC